MFRKGILLVLLLSIILSACGTHPAQKSSTAAIDTQESVTEKSETAPTSFDTKTESESMIPGSETAESSSEQEAETTGNDVTDPFSDPFDRILAEKNGKELEQDALSEMEAFFSIEKSPLPNTFLTVAFEDPSDIDVLAVFYNGLTSAPPEMSEEEKAAVWEAVGLSEDRIEIQKLIPAEMDTAFQKYTGHFFTDAQKQQVEALIYLPQYEAYYSCHSDSGLAHVKLIRGCTYTDESGEELLALEYSDMDIASEDNRGIVLLKKTGDGWLIQSNERP